jgi:uncharacterized protein (DUF58 family)
MVGSDLLSAERAGRLAPYAIKTDRALTGLGAGAHRSPRRGTSLDFADNRPYYPGDDIRRVDYHIYARLDQLVLRLFDAEDDLTVRFLIDTSASMGVGGKLRAAKEIAAGLGFVALERRDRVSVHTLVGAPASFTAGTGLGGMLAHLDRLSGSGTTDLGSSVRRVLSATEKGRSGLNIIVSDLLSPGWADAIRLAPARGATTVVIHLLHPHEIEPNLSGDLDLVDIETKERVSVSLDPAQILRVKTLIAEWMTDIKRATAALGCTYVSIRTDEDLETRIIDMLRQLNRGRVR